MISQISVKTLESVEMLLTFNFLNSGDGIRVDVKHKGKTFALTLGIYRNSDEYSIMCTRSGHITNYDKVGAAIKDLVKLQSVYELATKAFLDMDDPVYVDINRVISERNSNMVCDWPCDTADEMRKHRAQGPDGVIACHAYAFGVSYDEAKADIMRRLSEQENLATTKPH